MNSKKLLIMDWITIVGTVVGVLALIIGLNSNKEVEPLYAVSQTRVISTDIDVTDELKIVWESKELKRVYSTELVFWNAGKDYIDSSRVSKTDSLRACIDGAQILVANVLKTSRDSLKFELNKTKDESCININFIGDEALDNNDGALISLLYIGKLAGEVELKGRVKGVSDGFEKVNWNTVTTKGLNKQIRQLKLLVLIIMVAICSAFVILVLVGPIYYRKYIFIYLTSLGVELDLVKEEMNRKIISPFFRILLPLALVFNVLNMFYLVYRPYLNGLNWM